MPRVPPVTIAILSAILSIPDCNGDPIAPGYGQCTIVEIPGPAMNTDTITAPLTFRQVLAIAPFRRLWLAQLVSVLGDFLAIFAVLAVATFGLHATASQITF